MTITLMRHGKPDLGDKGLITPAEMGIWIQQYNSSTVSEKAPQSSINLASSVTHIVSSTAPRALSSLQALGHTPSVTDALFSEAQLPFSAWRFPHLSPKLWAAIFRVLWLCGYAKNAEAFQAAKARSKLAAHKLIALAKEDSVLLMGHGIMNRLIAKELVALGWVNDSQQKNHYWAATIYHQK